MRGEALVCDACHQSGTWPSVELENEISSESSESITRDGLAEPSCNIWPNDEVVVWAQVTMRMARSSSSKEDFHRRLHTRWEAA
jgi:hypothetical protein